MNSPGLRAAIETCQADYHSSHVTSGGIAAALKQFGLRPDPSLLSELSKDEAVAVLSLLLWKGMAYNEERIPQEEAKAFATEFVASHSGQTSKFLSNGNWAKHKGWNPLTDSTFDTGVIIESENNRFACLWFRDDD